MVELVQTVDTTGATKEMTPVQAGAIGIVAGAGAAVAAKAGMDATKDAKDWDKVSDDASNRADKARATETGEKAKDEIDKETDRKKTATPSSLGTGARSSPFTYKNFLSSGRTRCVIWKEDSRITRRSLSIQELV